MTELSEFCGSWLLRSCYLENVDTGERTETFGPTPRGVLMLQPEGRMAAIVTPTASKLPAAELDQAEAYRNLVAYSGRYRLYPPDKFVTTVDVAWFKPWIGSFQPRRFALGKDVLDIISDPICLPATGDAPVRGVLSWIREKP